MSQLLLSAGEAPSSDCACALSMILEPSWLSKVHEIQQTDEQLAPYLVCASFNDLDFVLRTVHLLSLPYQQPKNRVFLLIIPFENGLLQLLAEEARCTPLLDHIGACKVISMLQQRVWWLLLMLDVCTFICGCLICQQAKDSTQQTLGYLQPIPILSE